MTTEEVIINESETNTQENLEGESKRLVEESIKNELILYDINLSSVQVSKIRNFVVKTRFNKKYVLSLIKDPDLGAVPLDDRLFAIEQLEVLNATGTTLKKFVKEGYNVGEFVDIIKYARETTAPVVFIKKSYGNVPNLSNILGYDNLIFLDRISGNTHDPIILNSLITEITENAEDSQRGYGLAEIVQEMKKEYKRADKEDRETSFPQSVQKALNILNPSFNDAIIDDDYLTDLEDSYENIRDRD